MTRLSRQQRQWHADTRRTIFWMFVSVSYCLMFSCGTKCNGLVLLPLPQRKKSTHRRPISLRNNYNPRVDGDSPYADERLYLVGNETATYNATGKRTEEHNTNALQQPMAKFGDVVPLKTNRKTTKHTSFESSDETTLFTDSMSSSFSSSSSSSSSSKSKSSSSTTIYTTENSSSIKQRNIGVAFVAILLAIMNYLWQFTHPLTPVQLLYTMEQQSVPISAIGTNSKPTVVDFWAPWYVVDHRVCVFRSIDKDRERKCEESPLSHSFARDADAFQITKTQKKEFSRSYILFFFVFQFGSFNLDTPCMKKINTKTIW